MSVLVCVAALAACAARGPVHDPVVRKFTWYSLVGAEDIRRACEPGAPDRHRLVFNGDYREQVRVYELTADADGGALMVQQVRGPGNLAHWTSDDFLSPWRGLSFDVRLTPEQYQGLLDAFAADGLYDGAPKGLALYSDGHYWVAGACRDGRFSFNAWAYPSQAFRDLAFVPEVQRLDISDVPYPPPKAPDIGERLGPREAADGIWFQLRVGEKGLVGLAPLL